MYMTQTLRLLLDKRVIYMDLYFCIILTNIFQSQVSQQRNTNLRFSLVNRQSIMPVQLRLFYLYYLIATSYKKIKILRVLEILPKTWITIVEERSQGRLILFEVFTIPLPNKNLLFQTSHHPMEKRPPITLQPLYIRTNLSQNQMEQKKGLLFIEKIK